MALITIKSMGEGKEQRWACSDYFYAQGLRIKMGQAVDVKNADKLLKASPGKIEKITKDQAEEQGLEIIDSVEAKRVKEGKQRAAVEEAGVLSKDPDA